MFKFKIKWQFAICINFYFASVYGQHIEEVIVTSPRSEQILNTLPLSLGVVDSKTIKQQNADHPAEIFGLIPGANIQRGSGAEHLTALRSPVLTGGAGAGSFLYLQDGIPLRSPSFGNTNGLLGAQTELAERLEIIRGPSGPAYGANAIHGVINVITPEAKNKNTGTIGLTADSQQRYKGNGSINIKTDKNRWLLGTAFKKENGYRYNTGLEEQKLLLRQATAKDKIEIQNIVSAQTLSQDTAGYILGEEALKDRELRRENSVPEAYRKSQSLLAQSQISWSLSPQASARITPFFRWHSMDFMQHWFPGQAIEKNGHWSFGAHSDFNTSTDTWNILSGLDMEYTEGYLKEEQFAPTVSTFTQGIHYDYKVAASSLSGFIEGEVAISEKITASTGIRLDHTVYTYKNQTNADTVGRFLRPENRQDAYTTLSPKVSLQYTSSENLMSYLSLTRANRPPQTSDLYRLQKNQTDGKAKAEFMDALEIGTRLNPQNPCNRNTCGEDNELKFINRLSAHIAAYAMKKDNFFFRDADGFNVINGKTQHLGVELDFELKLSKTLTLSSALNYAEHTYQFNRNVSRDYEILTKGNQMDTAPRRTANTRLNWTASEKLNVEAQWIKMGEYYTDAANLHSYDGHDVFNLRVGYTLNTTTKMQLTIRNISDKLYAERADYAFGNDRYYPAEVRTINFGFSMVY